MDREKHKIIINTPDHGYEPYPVSIMNRYTYEATTFDPLSGKPATISYRLNKSGHIRIRIAHRDQMTMVIRTLQDWKLQDFGKYELKWDGKDASGNIVDNKKIIVLFESKDKDSGLEHRGHDESTCRDPLLVVKTRPDSTVRIKGQFEICTTFLDETSRFLSREGIEVKYYMDYKLFQAERMEPGVNNFIFRIDTSNLENGEHLLTVNIDDLNDHIGSAGVKIKVEN